MIAALCQRVPEDGGLMMCVCAGNPQLGGPLPSAISSLTALNTLRMSGCSFTGTIPVPWFSMSSLQTLDVVRGHALVQCPIMHMHMLCITSPAFECCHCMLLCEGQTLHAHHLP